MGSAGPAWCFAVHCILSPLVLVEDLVGWAEVRRDAGESHRTEYQGRTKTRSAFWKGLPSSREETEAGVPSGRLLPLFQPELVGVWAR